MEEANRRNANQADGLVTAAEGRKQIYRVILPKACITLYSKAGVSNIIVPKQNELKKGLVVSAKNPCVRSLSSQSHSSVCTICTCSSDSIYLGPAQKAYILFWNYLAD